MKKGDKVVVSGKTWAALGIMQGHTWVKITTGEYRGYLFHGADVGSIRLRSRRAKASGKGRR